ncbi:hypothetical protein BGZ72_003567, partial [Mortierella alpina]
MDLLSFRTNVASKLLSVSAQYDVIFRIRDLPNMKLLHIELSREHIKFVGSAQKQATHACKMSYELRLESIGDKEFGLLPEVLNTNSPLATLNLKYNGIDSNRTKALAEALKTNSTLTTLDLSSNNIGDDGKALAEALKTNSTLANLSLENNWIGDVGAKALAEALKTNSTLIT